MCLPTRLPAIITGDFPFGSKRNLNTSADGWRSVPKNKPALFTPRSSLIGWRVCGEGWTISIIVQTVGGLAFPNLGGVVNEKFLDCVDVRYCRIVNTWNVMKPGDIQLGKNWISWEGVRALVTHSHQSHTLDFVQIPCFTTITTPSWVCRLLKLNPNSLFYHN